MATSFYSPADEPEELRVGIVGLGFAGTTHLDAFKEIPGVTVVALAGQEEARLHELGSTRGVKNLYLDWEDLVARNDLDIVSIGSPNDLHHAIALASLNSGKHVFCEKPLATTAALANEIIEAAVANNRVLEVAFNHRRREDVRFLQRYLDANDLGGIYHVRASWRHRNGIPRTGSWFTSRAMAGGGPMIDLGSHMLDIVLHLMHEPRVESVSAVAHGELGRRNRGRSRTSRSTGTNQKFEVEDFASALLRLEGGATVHLEAAWASYSADENDFSVELLGGTGGARLFVRNYASTGTLQLYADLEGAPVVTYPDVRVKGNEHRAVIEEFLATIRSGEWGNSHGQFALHRSQVLDAIYESAREQREVTLG